MNIEQKILIFFIVMRFLGLIVKYVLPPIIVNVLAPIMFDKVTSRRKKRGLSSKETVNYAKKTLNYDIKRFD